MSYIIGIQTDRGAFYVLNVHGNWNTRPRNNPIHSDLPMVTALQIFRIKEAAESASRNVNREAVPSGKVEVVEVPTDISGMTLSEIQKELATTWTLESYSDEFKAVKLPYRDFDHSLKHVMKATGKLVAVTEEADHNAGPAFQAQKVANYLADLIICSIRMASKYPMGEIDIEKAVIARIKEKADVPV